MLVLAAAVIALLLIVILKAHAIAHLYSLSSLAMVDGTTIITCWDACQPIITYRVNAQLSASLDSMSL
jgi:hypothetical protein